MSAQSTGFDAMPGWYWPEDTTSNRGPSTAAKDTTVPDPQPDPQPEETSQAPSPGQDSQQQQQQQRAHYRPRTCRICLDTVQPSFGTPLEDMPNIFQGRSKVVYEDESGRLIRPCKCKGSARYVHENCLQEWRHADPGYGKRNYYNCPTCGYRYRLARMSWGYYMRSASTQVTLTIAVMILSIFFLGFIADPIINLYLDPWSFGFSSRMAYDDTYGGTVVDDDYDDGPTTWAEHFFKGTASVGVLGFIKVMLSSPFQIFRMGGGRARVARTGRDRANDISTVVIILGLVTFAYGIWKAVRAWSRRTLERASERVMDVQGDNDDQDDEDEGQAT